MNLKSLWYQLVFMTVLLIYYWALLDFILSIFFSLVTSQRVQHRGQLRQAAAAQQWHQTGGGGTTPPGCPSGRSSAWKDTGSFCGNLCHNLNSQMCNQSRKKLLFLNIVQSMQRVWQKRQKRFRMWAGGRSKPSLSYAPCLLFENIQSYTRFID